MSVFGKVSKWNNRCGNTPVLAGTEQYYATIRNQLERIAEELNEAITAVDNKDLLELVDGGLDLDVVVAGLNYLIGADYNVGISRVLANNELKYTKSSKVAKNWLAFHTDNGIAVYLQETVIGSQTFYCVRRDGDGKIMKYGNFPKVDLSDILPEQEIEIFLLVPDELSVTKEMADFTKSVDMSVMLFDRISTGEGEPTPNEIILGNVIKEAESNAAFIYVINGTLCGAENFTVEGPTGVVSKSSDVVED